MTAPPALSLPPRFPQPFVDALGGLLAWRDVLSLTSVDWREWPSRRYWIDSRSAVIVSLVQPSGELSAFITRFPRCEQRPVSWANVAFSAIVAFSGAGIAQHYDQEVLDSAQLRRSLCLSSGCLILESNNAFLLVRDDFEHVIASFLDQLPVLLHAGQGMMFQDHYGPECVLITLVDGIVTFDDLHSNCLKAPAREVLVALADARARLDRIVALAKAERESETAN